jgi:hypothetical protein
MDRIGNDEAGFTVEFDAVAKSVRVNAWGFWDAPVAAAFGNTVKEGCRFRPPGTELVLDMTKLKPMRELGQESFGDLMEALPGLAISRTTVVTASHLTKLQLLRIASARGKKGSVTFVSAEPTKAI